MQVEVYMHLQVYICETGQVHKGTGGGSTGPGLPRANGALGPGGRGGRRAEAVKEGYTG